MTMIDNVDAKILKELLKDGRKEFSEIAKEIGVSKNAISQRFSKMEKSGIIIGATTQINYGHLGYQTVELLVTIGNESLSRIQENVPKLMAEIHNAYGQAFNSSNGRNILFLFFYTKDLSEVELAKKKVSEYFYTEEIKTYVWTGIKNIPENLSFGLPKIKVNSKSSGIQSESIINPSKTTKTDDLDLKIIDKLTEKGRSPFRKIAEDLGVTTDTVVRRYDKLKLNNTLNIVIQIIPEKIGYHANLEFRVRLNSQETSISVIKALAKIPDIFHISRTTGNYELHVWSLIRNLEDYFDLHTGITSIRGIERVQTELNKNFLSMYPGPRQNITTI